MSSPSQTPPPAGTRPVQHRKQIRNGLRRQARMAGIMAAALVISWGGPAANAFWQTLSSNAGVAKADSIPAVAAPAAYAASGAASVSWLQGATVAGRPVAGYNVARYSAATGGTGVAAGGGCAGTLTTLACTEASLPAGTWYYTVTPVLGAWVGAESARSGGITAVDTTPPAAPTIAAPAVISSATAASVPVSGTAEAGSSVTVAVKDAGALHTSSQTVVANSSGQWSAANFNLTTFTDGTITYTAVATDAAGNASAAGTAASAKDTVAPTATVTLSSPSTNAPGVAEAGDTVTIKYSGDINSKSICSTWTNGVQPPEIAGNNVVTVNINTNILTVTTTGAAGCTLNIGPVTLGGNYGSLTFKGNSNSIPSKVAWNNATQTLTVTLGTRSGTFNTGVAESSPTVAPPVGVTDTSGNQAVGAAPAAPSRF